MPHHGVRAGLLVVITAALVAGCGSSGSSSSSTSGSGGAGRAVEAQVARLFRGTFSAPPTPSPPPAEGKSIWLLSCGQSQTTCALNTAAAKSAAEALGWKATVFDTASDPAKFAVGVRQAIAAGADGILVYAIDCPYIKSPLTEAKRAGIPVVAAESFDCSPPLFASVVTYGADGQDYPAFIKSWGAAQAAEVIDRTGGKATVVQLKDNLYAGTKAAVAGQSEELAKCAGCKVYPVVYDASELVTGLKQRTQQALLTHPDANAVMVPYDSAILGGVSAGVDAAHRDVFLMGGNGDPGVVDLVKAGKVGAIVGIPVDWEGWAEADALNRIFAEQEPRPSGIGMQLADESRNLPASGPYQPPVDFESDYRKAWGAHG